MLDLSNEKHAHIDERLRSNVILWLSSVKPDGTPHIVPVWFLWDGDTILIFSKPDQKIRNLRQNRAVMVALDDSKDGDDPIMLAGEATLLPRDEATAADPAYVAKYKSQLDSYNWTGESMSKEYSEPISIRPTRVFA
ncbi:MAG: pyridoxamine 5'-phosphate oxidase family protein [Chloroflexota bacterium]